VVDISGCDLRLSLLLADAYNALANVVKYEPKILMKEEKEKKKQISWVQVGPMDVTKSPRQQPHHLVSAVKPLGFAVKRCPEVP
jgi:hypothetical protein